ncbi:MAG: type II toxin-antitoxin system Phd/YefM family antitoxin [Pyrinomonadaceae bacterium]|nr:type II toxin-antitoxin system Phd/YefM family antitoxin [Pyrinomonadaceae bacterium]
MISLKDGIDSLSNFKRNTADFLRQLKKSGSPLVLTVNGKAEVVVQDAASYQRLLEISERLETIEALRPAIAEMRAGKGEPAEVVFEQLLAESTK